MFYEVIHVLQILVCIIIAVPGILIVLNAQTTAGRVTAAGITLLAIFFSWEIGYFIYEMLCLLFEAILMLFGYISLIALAVLIMALPVLLILKWLFGF